MFDFKPSVLIFFLSFVIIRKTSFKEETMSYLPSEKRYEKMCYLPAGASGLKMSALSLGLWHNFGVEDDFSNMKKMIFTAFDNGITCFDLANTYGRPLFGSAETNFGKILKDNLSAFRDQLVISTKAGYAMWDGPYGNGGGRKYLLSSLDQSLKRLGVDYVDIFYHHRPDPETPFEETALALAAAVNSGKALYVGLSNYDGEGLAKAAKILDELHVPFIVNQNRYSILDRTVEKNGLIDAARESGKGVIAFSPLAQGLLAGRYSNGIPSDSRVRTNGFSLKESAITDEKLSAVRGLAAIASERGETLSQTALAWVLSRETVCGVIIGASSPAQILENVKAANYAPFSAEELAAIDEITKNATI